MRYVPNLIPNKSKVLQDYFKSSPNLHNQTGRQLRGLGWILGLFFLFVAFICIVYPVLVILFGLLGLILLPPGHRWIEKTLRFHFTMYIKSVVVIMLCISILPFIIYYGTIYKETAQKNAYQLQLKAEKEQREADEKRKAYLIRIDSINAHIEVSNNFEKRNKTELALKELEYALTFASEEAEIKQIQKLQYRILSTQTISLVKQEKFKIALPELNNLISKTGNNSELLYYRAVCYSKTGKMQEAVNDCNSAIQLGNKDAKKLYDKINPIKKRVAYYVTRCCDGSTSSSSGRGTCSHHGGVCDWNEPVYEEYRKY